MGSHDDTQRVDKIAMEAQKQKELSLMPARRFEVTTIGWPTIDGVRYRLSIHGFDKDHDYPLFYLDRADDPECREFMFDIALVDTLYFGDLVLVRQKDLKAKVDRFGTGECSWNGYEKLHDGLFEYLESNLEDDAPKGSRSNLESLIIAWNKESGPNPNRLAEYIKGCGIEVLDRYRMYFPATLELATRTSH